jgi:hypothetical protein
VAVGDMTRPWRGGGGGGVSPQQQQQQQQQRPSAAAGSETLPEARARLDAAQRMMRLDYVLLRHLESEGHAAAALELLAAIAGVGNDLRGETQDRSSSVVLEEGEEEEGEGGEEEQDLEKRGVKRGRSDEEEDVLETGDD